jgi:hypothetical protein
MHGTWAVGWTKTKTRGFVRVQHTHNSEMTITEVCRPMYVFIYQVYLRSLSNLKRRETKQDCHMALLVHLRCALLPGARPKRFSSKFKCRIHPRTCRSTVPYSTTPLVRSAQVLLARHIRHTAGTVPGTSPCAVPGTKTFMITGTSNWPSASTNVTWGHDPSCHHLTLKRNSGLSNHPTTVYPSIPASAMCSMEVQDIG